MQNFRSYYNDTEGPDPDVEPSECAAVGENLLIGSTVWENIKKRFGRVYG
jgi:hypothetical protein